MSFAQRENLPNTDGHVLHDADHPIIETQGMEDIFPLVVLIFPVSTVYEILVTHVRL